MTPWPIDLDTESIQYDGHWYTRDELARRIKSMLDAGDFAVGKPSQALEQLTVTLSTLRSLSFKITPEMADAVQQAAARQGRTIGGLIREAISDYLGFAAMPARDGARDGAPAPEKAAQGAPAAAAQPSVAQIAINAMKAVPPPPMPASGHGRKPTDPELPVVSLTTTTPGMAVPPDLKTTQQMVLPPQVIAGPGALKSAAPMPSVMIDRSAIVTEDASPEEAASAVTMSPKKKTEEEPAERGWFGR